MWVLIGRLRLDIVEATALKVALVIPYTLAALAIFAAAGQVEWIPGFGLSIGAIGGALLGVRVTLKHTSWLRWCVLLAVVGAVLLLGYERVAKG